MGGVPITEVILEPALDPFSAEGRLARSAEERERMRRSRYHLATSRVLVQVDPADPTSFAGMVAPDGTTYLIAVTNTDFIPVVWSDPAGTTLAIGMPDLLRHSNPALPIGIDPFWEDPITIWPQDRAALLDWAQAFPTQLQQPAELEVLADGELVPWRAEFLKRLQEERLRARVWLVKTRILPDADQWVTVVIEGSPPDVVRIGDLAMQAAAATGTEEWINTARWEVLGGTVPGYAKKFLKAHGETRLLDR
ncbi:hypothetical protein P5G50_01915 [Leifsonia sp. F6_8S_P_1B]|uniref:Uncharacterized protein n=1 Tax=Leifsonia williamsii TaxID=3035919 RepID=A0ABT8K6W9_9MICO|nr:hypothetical protein [Leifsonia williamsii]MDN4613195.1 hypothetical protein [Leifsonia williamsii]